MENSLFSLHIHCQDSTSQTGSKPSQNSSSYCELFWTSPYPWSPQFCLVGIDLCCMLQPFWATCYSLMILWFLISMPLYHLVPLVEVARCPFPLPFFCICISLWLSSSVTSSGKTCFYHTVNTLCLCFFGLCLDFHYSHPGNIFLVPVFFKALNVGTMSIPHPTPTPFFYLKPSPQ